ncbi:MSC_0622 family F1-like ATPase gamma subunit [Mycoplasmopsis synoviae]|uniref:MSC_0622 family F1-like ATPase gamma subunit n=1 Tax=Mycoplasmopsis synoviae TaxID=2109 RepID=UPI0035661764
MNVKSLVNKRESYTKIKKIVESDKNITLINILRLSKQNVFYFERSLQAKYYIESLAKRYEIKHSLILQKQLKILSKLSRVKSIWVYITEEEKFATNSYQRHERNMKKSIDFKRDFLVVIGKRANEFATKHKAHVIFSHDKNDVEFLVKILPKFLQNYLKTNGFHNLNFVINSSKLKEAYLSVLPLNKLNFKIERNLQNKVESVDTSKLKIYPEIKEFINSEFESYLTYVSLSLLSESALISEKYKLVALNKTLNDLNEKLRLLNIRIEREKRELEVEQISILFKKKDLLHSSSIKKEGS